MRSWFTLMLVGCGFAPIPAQQQGDATTDGHHDGRSPDTRPLDARPDAPWFSVRYNIGGSKFNGSTENPGTWLADSEPDGICGATAFVYPAPFGTTSINGTTDIELYGKMAYAAPLQCTVPSIPHGTYSVRMLFAELSRGNAPCTTATTRELTITIAGTVVEPMGDVGVLGGGCAAVTNTNNGGGHAFDLTFPNIAITNTLDFTISGNATNGIISAIEIVQTAN